MVKQKLSKSSRPFILTIKEKTIDVAIDLDILFEKAKKFWFQFLKLTRMYECYEYYQNYIYEIPTILPLPNFIKRNILLGKDIANVLRTANDVINLIQYCSNLKAEKEKSEQQIRKNSFSKY